MEPKFTETKEEQSANILLKEVTLDVSILFRITLFKLENPEKSIFVTAVTLLF